jgi:hypothetical protein
MPTVFKIHGPCDVPYSRAATGSAKRIRADGADLFWQAGGAARHASSKGCYVFGLRSGGGTTPWYVGKTTKTFEQECFTPDKLHKYNDVLWQGKKGTPVLFFVVFPTKQGRPSKRKITEVEKFLIQTALTKNNQLVNKANTRNLPDWGLGGIVNAGQGKPSESASRFRSMMGL